MIKLLVCVAGWIAIIDGLNKDGVPQGVSIAIGLVLFLIYMQLGLSERLAKMEQRLPPPSPPPPTFWQSVKADLWDPYPRFQRHFEKIVAAVLCVAALVTWAALG